MATTEYGDISRTTAGYYSADLLERGMPFLIIEKFAQSKPLPSNKGTSMTFTRYNSIDLATTPLTEGVTPAGKKLTSTNVVMSLAQYGDVLPLTDVVADNHEDPVLKEMSVIIGEQASKTIETVRYGVLKACTNVFYANGTARTSVNTAISIGKIRKVTRALKRQNAEQITTAIKSTPNFNTESVSPSFICLCHTDCESDIRGVSGFIDVKDYGAVTPYPSEVGSVEGVRFLTSNIYEPYDDAGGAKGSTISTTGTSSDVYPYIFLARNFFAVSALKGQYAITPIVINPTPSKSDPLGQRGTVAWKTMQGCVILNDLWGAVLEAAVNELS